MMILLLAGAMFLAYKYFTTPTFIYGKRPSRAEIDAMKERIKAIKHW
jgi:hypothetical protein